MQPIDYGRSFVLGNGPENEVRFWLESRTRLIDTSTGKLEDYLQCASCKSEATFAEKELFTPDNYDFLPVFGPDWGLVFRRKAWLNDGYRDTRPATDWWNGQSLHLVEAPMRELTTPEEARQATYSHAPLIAQVELHGESGIQAIIECPIKTMNTNRERDIYQVDTGPVLLPDLQRHECSADGLRLAFVAFNVADFADFVIEVPTSIDEATGTEVHHYSERVSLPSTNRLFVQELS